MMRNTYTLFMNIRDNLKLYSSHSLRVLGLGFLLGIPCLVGCDSRVGDTVESSFLEYEWQEPVYSFKRNTTSSVVLTECDLLKQPIDYLYTSRLRSGRISNKTDLEMALRYFSNGLNGEKPAEAVATSSLHKSHQDKVRADLDTLIHQVAYIVGLGRDGGIDAVRSNTQASQGHSGFVGRNIGDPDRYYVDSLGFAPSEIFYYYIVGAIYMDRVFNTHLDYSFYSSEETRAEHEAGRLVPGNNYTKMEHSWDLAYGYYQLCRPVIFDTNGINALKGVDRKIRYAFAYGRKAMSSNILWYSEVDNQARSIRREFSRAIVLRVMSMLMDVNVSKNLSETRTVSMAFERLSQATGLLLSLQFIRTEDDQPLFSVEELTRLIDTLKDGIGLWDHERLRSSSETKGSLAYVATEIGKKLNLSLDLVIR